MYIYIIYNRNTSLGKNEEQNFHFSECKTVHINSYGSFIKMVLHKNHKNNINIHNQIGLRAIKVEGEIIGRDPV